VVVVVVVVVVVAVVVVAAVLVVVVAVPLIRKTDGKRQKAAIPESEKRNPAIIKL
jgi:NADH:ubiquinone oxidoreductase subunit 3 (subunit A)